MKMMNRDIEGFVNFIMSEELSSKLSRMRSRFVEGQAKPQMNLINEERMEIVSKYCKKDDQGELKVIEDEHGNSRYDIEDMEGFNKDFLELMNEYFVVEANQEKKEMLECIKQIVINTPKLFKGSDAIEYDKWCDIVEELNM